MTETLCGGGLTEMHQARKEMITRCCSLRIKEIEMDVTRCDKCGVLSEKSAAEIADEGKWKMLRCEDELRTDDLCPRCYKKYLEFLKGD